MTRPSVKLFPSFIVLTLATAMSSTSLADPFSLTYAGRFANSQGRGITGPVDIEVLFFRNQTGGSPLAVPAQNFTAVVLADGVFQVNLNGLTQPELNFIFNTSADVWVQLRDATNNNTLPRQRYTAIPYALKVPVDGTSITYDFNGALTLGPNGFRLGGNAVSNATPVSGDVLRWNGTNWGPAVPPSAPVGSVAGRTGAVTLNADDIAETGSKKWLSSADKTKLDGIVSGDPVNSSTVAAAGAVMHTNFSANGILKRTAAGTYTSITDNTANWDSAFGWGNHGIAGYIGLGSLSAAPPLTYNSGTGAFALGQASGVSSGYLSIADFLNFSNKQSAITGTTNITLNNLSAKNNINLEDSDGSAIVSLKAKDETTASYTLTLPDNDGDSGQILRTDGTGNLSWISPGGGGDMMSFIYDAGGSPGIVDNSEALGGFGPGYFLNASNISSGTLAEARIDAAIARDSEIPSAARAALSGSAPITYNSGTGAIGISAATTGISGSMSAADKTKLDSVAAGAGPVNSSTVAAAGSAMHIDFSADGILKRTGAGTYTSVTDNSTNWNNAVSWGDHSSAGYINLSSLSATAPLAYNGGTGVFSLGQASGVSNGYLSFADFLAFSNKQSAITGASNITVNNLTAKNVINLEDDDASAVVSIKAKDSTTASYTLTLPDNDGDNGQMLRTDGTGNLSWVSVGGGGDMLASVYDGGGAPGVVDNAEALGGFGSSYYLNASNISSGLLAEARIDAAVARVSGIPAAARAALSGTAPITYNSGTGVFGIVAATTGVPGSMSAADKTKLDSVVTGAGPVNSSTVAATGATMHTDFSANGILKRTGSGTYISVTDNSTNWNSAFSWGNHSSAGYIGLTGLSATAPLTYNSGTGAFGIAAATTGVPGSMSSADKTKLDGITTGATVTNTASVTAAGAVMHSQFGSNGIMTRTGAGTYAIATDNSANWNTAHTDRLKWDGAATGLNATTGRTSLGLGDLAVQSAGAVAVTGGSVNNVTLSTNKSITTPSGSLVLASGSNDDVVIGAGNNLVVSGPGSDFIVTGLSAGSDGRRIRIENDTPWKMSLVHESVSTPANQINLGFGGSITVGSGQTVSLIYNASLARWKVDSASHDYEEGTFLPTYAGSTTTGVCTYSQQYGHYVRTGKTINFTIYLLWSACSTAPVGAPLRVNGLPYIARNIVNMQQIVQIMPTNYTSGVNGILSGAIQPNSQYIALKVITAVSLSANSNAAVDTAATLLISGSYLIE